MPGCPIFKGKREIGSLTVRLDSEGDIYGVSVPRCPGSSYSEKTRNPFSMK